MRKFVTAILAVLYLGTSSGATMHMHYCMGQLADWGMSNSKSKACPKCGMEQKDKVNKGCCSDQQQFIKDTSPQIFTENLQIFQLFSAAIPVSFIELTTLNILSENVEIPSSHAPPRQHGVAIYISKRSFLI